MCTCDKWEVHIIHQPSVHHPSSLCDCPRIKTKTIVDSTTWQWQPMQPMQITAPFTPCLAYNASILDWTNRRLLDWRGWRPPPVRQRTPFQFRWTIVVACVFVASVRSLPALVPPMGKTPKAGDHRFHCKCRCPSTKRKNPPVKIENESCWW